MQRNSHRLLNTSPFAEFFSDGKRVVVSHVSVLAQVAAPVMVLYMIADAVLAQWPEDPAWYDGVVEGVSGDLVVVRFEDKRHWTYDMKCDSGKVVLPTAGRQTRQGGAQRSGGEAVISLVVSL